MKSRLKQSSTLIIAVVLTALDYIVAVLSCDMVYRSNDDGSIQGALSGAWTGSPEPFHQFIHVIISYPIAGLYKLFPGVQWWYVLSQILVAVGIFLIHFCFLKLARKNNFSMPLIIGVILYIDLGFFIFAISNIAFTVVPAILGTGIVAVLFWMAEAEKVRYKNWLYVGSIIGYVILFAWRKGSGTALLCYILLMFLYYFVSRCQNWKKAVIKFLYTAGILIGITATLLVTSNIAMEKYNGEDFVAFNNARIQYMDYPHISYEEDPELFEEIGWDSDTYTMAENWGFINEHINTETLSYVTENSEYTRADAVNLLKETVYDEFCFPLIILGLASFIMAGFVAIVYHKKKTMIFWLINNAGTVVLFLYEIMGGRMNYRSLIVIVLPAVVINLMLSFRHEMEKKFIRNTYVIITIVLGALCIWPVLYSTYNGVYRTYVTTTKERYQNTCEYVMEHPDNLYITQGQAGVGDCILPSSTSVKTYNLMKWGAPYYYSDLYYSQLEANGLTELTGETFKNDNVYFVTSTNALSESYVDNGDNIFAVFCRYLEKEHGALGFVLEDTIAGEGYVYHFVFEENEDQYDSYYDIVDGRTVRIQP